MTKSLAVFGLLASSLFAEDSPRVKSVEMSYGDSAFTSGLNIATVFALDESMDFELVGNSERFYSTLNFKFGKRLSLDATGGSFKKLPWVGPRVVIKPVSRIMFLYWGGWSSGRIGALKAEIKSFCQQGSVYAYPWKGLAVGYNVVKVDVYKTTQLPEIAYGVSLTESVRLGASATYDTVARKPLLCMSLKYVFR